MRIYADTDFFLALVKDSDWLQEAAAKRFEEHRDALRTSLVTFLEVFLVSDRLGVDREAAAAHMLEIAPLGSDALEDVVFQAAEYMDEGVGTFDAFHAALAGTDPILSSDGVYDKLGIRRIPFAPEEPGGG